MEPKRELAIVLRSVAFQERHRIVTALTENFGQVSALAKNSVQSRRFGGALEPFAASEWIYTEKPGAEMWSLNEATIRRSYDGLRSDFERLSQASVMNELMIKLAPQFNAAPELFRLHANALAVLDEATGQGADLKLLNGYLAKVLQWSGSQPQVGACAGCQRPLLAFDARVELSCMVADAAWVCPQCRSEHTRHIREAGGMGNATLRVGADAVRDFELALSVPIRQISALSQASHASHCELFRFLEALFIYHVPGFDKQPLKGLRFLNLESNLPPASAFRR